MEEEEEEGDVANLTRLRAPLRIVESLPATRPRAASLAMPDAEWPASSLAPRAAREMLGTVHARFQIAGSTNSPLPPPYIDISPPSCASPRIAGRPRP